MKPYTLTPLEHAEARRRRIAMWRAQEMQVDAVRKGILFIVYASVFGAILGGLL